VTLREKARAVFDAALRAGDVGPLVHRALEGLALPPRGRVLVVGAGKASGAMATAAEAALGDRVADGVVAVKDGHLAPTRRVRLLEAGHPVPDRRGAEAARAIRDLASTAAEDDLVLVLVSGGGSALTPAPAPPITLEEKQSLTRLLLRAGANINQLNAVRKHCSTLKGGQLARAAAPARVQALLLSDVIGNPLDVIASGPTAPDASTFAEAMGILDRFDIRDQVAPSIVARLQQGMQGEIPETPKPGDPLFERVRNLVIGNNALVVDAAAAAARELGLTPLVLTRSLDGEAREVARRFAAMARDIREGRGPVAPPCCVIAGGETTVTVRGQGSGGRCQEFALSAAGELDGLPGVVVLAAGTDGSDGPTTAAGAIVDGESARRARAAGVDLSAHLADNSSHAALEALGDLLVTGPTNTNLLDLYLVVVGSPNA
jgi:glycerate 2-kinase